MINEIDKILQEAKSYLLNNKLHNAIHSLHDIVYSHPDWLFIDDFEHIEDNYQMMIDYMKRGFKDDKRQVVFDQQKFALNSFLQKIAQRNKNFNHEFILAQSKIKGFDISLKEIKEKLQNFVTDIALVGLEANEADRSRRSKEMFQAHQEFIDRLFCRIWVSETWNAETADGIIDMLLSDTIDVNDVQMIVSAITIGGIEFYDFQKLRVLVSVYMRSADVNIRQRALVGFSFVFQRRTFETTELHELVRSLLSEDDTQYELLELQKQIMYCKNAERDHETIQKEIMPDLMKNGNLKITRFGVEEKEDDPMRDILDPDADDRSAEKVEKNIERIMKMQNNGADIYFGGFSMMKNFPFFNDLSNWLCPFYLEHPGLSEVTTEAEQMKVVQAIINSGPFCDSDKYSFCLALGHVLDSLTTSMKEMLSSGGIVALSDLAQVSATAPYIRRGYLQSLYRLYRVSSCRIDLVDPFKLPMLFEDSFFTSMDSRLMVDLAVFMNKHGNQASARQLLLNVRPPYTYVYYMVKAEVLPDYNEYEEALKLRPDDELALSKYAEKLLVLDERADLASDIYRRLVQLYPCKKYETDLASCLVDPMLGKYGEALQLLYKVNFEHPDYMKAVRVLAWCLFCMGKSDQAEKYYQQILNQKKVYRPDFLNAGHVAWVNGAMDTALSRYKSYASMYGSTSHAEVSNKIDQDFTNDMKILKMYGLTDVDIRLMIDIVVDSQYS